MTQLDRKDNIKVLFFVVVVLLLGYIIANEYSKESAVSPTVCAREMNGGKIVTLHCTP